MPAFREGQQNLLGLTNPGVYIGVVPPTPFVAGVPTNIEAMVGVGSWGPVNAVISGTTLDDAVAAVGPVTNRRHDLSKSVAAATQLGNAINFRWVRVTDGTDTAASAAITTGPSGNTVAAGTFTARYTGSRGNAIAVSIQATAMANAFAAIVNFPGRTPERFDNIANGLATLTVTPGTGYTSVPALAIPAPAAAGGVQAVAQASLKVVSAAVGTGGTGYTIGDVITLANGVRLAVASVTSGAVATVTVQNAGSLTSGAVPTNPVAQSSATGSGTGATFALTWGLGPATILNAGSGYTASTPTVTLVGGGAGTGGSIAATASFWGGLAAAINNGNDQRVRSAYVIFTPGVSTAAPTVGTTYTLAGGTDGAAGVTTAHLIGQDAQPRTGMYALRGLRRDQAGVPDTLTLVDCTDTSVWGAMLSFGLSESLYPVVAMPSGSTIVDAITARASQGIDDTNIKIIAGDWPTLYIPTLGSILISPATVFQGLCGNLSPEQSPINKALTGVVATVTSQTGVLTSDAEESIAQTGGVDFIGKSAALGADYFSFMTGRNASSNTAAQGDEYTRLTNFLVRSLQGAATRSIVGRLQSTRADDPTRSRAKGILDSFFADLKNPASGSGGYGMIDNFAVICDSSNNTPTTIARGFLFAFCTVRYLNVVRYFVIRLAGGGNVDITVQNVEPTLATVIQFATP